MLYLGPVKDEESIKELFLLHNIEYTDNSLCVDCRDGEKRLGYCLFDLDDKKITVKYVEPLSDIPLADGILRSSLHVAAKRSIMNAYYEDTVPCDFLKKTGFIKNEAEKTLNIDKLFASCACKQSL